MTKEGRQKSKKALWVVLLILVSIPLLQDQLSFANERKLGGAYNSASNSEWSLDGWFTGDYQGVKAGYINENFGFRKFFVRVYSQLQYSFFDEILVKSVIEGKEGFLFEKDYISAYYGKDYIGDEAWAQKAKQLASVRDTLESMGKEVVVILMPGKGSFYPEYIPDELVETEMHKTNYQEWSALLKSENINLLDVRPWILAAKDTSRFPLYPRRGIHLSNYAEYLVMDSLVRFVQDVTEFELGDIVLDSIVLSNEMRATDDDLEKSMNLLFNIPDDEMAYPEIHYVTKPENERPKMVTIADSFFWGIFNAHFTTRLFRKSEFWYYFQSIYPEIDRNSYKVSHYSLVEELKEVDIVMILCTEPTIYKMGFIEAAYSAYFGDKSERDVQFKLQRIAYYVDVIKATPEWFAKVVKQAEEKGISVEECVRENAEYVVLQESVE